MKNVEMVEKEKQRKQIKGPCGNSGKVMKHIQSVSKGEIFEITSTIVESVHHSARIKRLACRLQLRQSRHIFTV